MSEKRTQADRDFDLKTGRDLERRDARLDEWIAYADKLEVALKLACGQTTDSLMRMHAEQGLRIVRPDASLT